MTQATTSTGFRREVDALLDRLIARFYREVPFGQHMLKDDSIDLEYYKRHNVETVLRIRAKRTVDALAIRWFTKHDPVRAKAWAHYTDDEMLHDRMFVRDLQAVGMSEEEIYGTEPFLATRLMMGYLLHGQEYDETPLALISSVYFVEYTTTRTQPQWLDNLERVLGKDKVKGARAHANIDLDDKHDDFVWDVLQSLVHSPADERMVLRHMEEIYRLYAMYFDELYHAVVVPREERSAAERMAVGSSS